MTTLPREAHTSTLHQDPVREQPRSYSARRTVAQVAAVVLILFIYSYPSLKARSDFGPASLPPMFAPDLSLYLNVANAETVAPGQVLNPYYLIPVPARGTAYLKFRLGAVLFSGWNKLLVGQMWLAMFTWNVFWWVLLCAVALWLFERFSPGGSWKIGIAGLGLLTLVNTGMIKPLLFAWIHLPSLSGFQSVALPFMRAFSPQIPIPLLLGYLGLQMGALRGRSPYRWIGMAVLQLLALSAFPYATLMMAGLTFVSVSWVLLSRGPRGEWQLPLVYGAACAVLDGAFLMRGSMNIYASHSSIFHFQPQLLPHLVGGAWLLVCLLTIVTVFSKNLPPEVKWPLAGLGATNVILMLGDAAIPSTVLLLSTHASYFTHTTVAVLSTFLVSAALVRTDDRSTKVRIAFGVVFFVLALNGTLLSLGTYRAFLPANREQVAVARLLGSTQPGSRQPAGGELVIARSKSVDDACGWAALLSKAPVLFCTDAEIMLTPEQNRDVHRFRQAVYLYLTGEDSNSLERALTAPNPSSVMYNLGYWAEATSLAVEERNEGIREIRADLIPLVERVERHDIAVNSFFRKYGRIMVIDNQRDPTFKADRLASFLKLEGQENSGDLILLSYVPK